MDDEPSETSLKELWASRFSTHSITDDIIGAQLAAALHDRNNSFETVRAIELTAAHELIWNFLQTLLPAAWDAGEQILQKGAFLSVTSSVHRQNTRLSEFWQLLANTQVETSEAIASGQGVDASTSAAQPQPVPGPFLTVPSNAPVYFPSRVLVRDAYNTLTAWALSGRNSHSISRLKSRFSSVLSLCWYTVALLRAMS